MPVPIKMPDFGTAVNEVRILKWLVEPGASVARGTLLAEVETDKAATELESAAEGVLLKQCVPADTVVESGQLIAWVGKPGEKPPEDEARRAATTAIAAAAPGSARERPRVAPVVANLAKKMGVELESLQGTGEHGAITREDVMRAARGAPAAAAGEDLPAAQAAVARAVSKSHAEIPHLRIAAAIDMTAVRRLRAQDPQLGYDAFFLKAMARAQQAVPVFGSRLEGQRLIAPDGIHMAVAVGFGAELLLPVVRDVNRKDLAALQRELEDLAARARQRSLRPEEMAGASTALSNLGMYPVEWFEAIIFPGHSAILALGAAVDRPVVVDGRVEIRPVANVTLAADHRYINGRTAAEYLSQVKETIESGVFE